MREKSKPLVIKEIFTEDKTIRYQLCYDESLHNKYVIFGYFYKVLDGKVLKSTPHLYWWGATEQEGLVRLNEFKARREELHNNAKPARKPRKSSK